VKEYLNDHPLANPKAVNEAWTEEGMEGAISDTLVNKMRSMMGLSGNLRGKRETSTSNSSAVPRPYTGKKRGRKPKSETIPAATKNVRTTKASRPSESVVELETELDRLLFKVMNMKSLPDVEEALRDARRALYAAHTGR
jgi:hypothetical protein